MGIGRSPRHRRLQAAYKTKRIRKTRKFDDAMGRSSRPFFTTINGIRVKVFLVPASKKALGDVVIVPRVHFHFGFLDHIDEEHLSNGERWYTLHFDCVAAPWFLANAQRMAQPGFPFDQIALDADSCVIELSLEWAQIASLDQRLVAPQGSKPLQHLQVGSWWLLEESSVPSVNTLPVVKYLPYPGSTDPTTILNSGREVATLLSGMRIPPPQVLQALVAVSHPGNLASRYPGR